MRHRIWWFLVLLLLPLQVGAQTRVVLTSTGGSRLLVSRAELMESLEWHQILLDSNPSDRSLHQQAADAVEYLQRRLEEGDFRPGDQIGLWVDGQTEFPDTLVVEPGPAVLLPNAGVVSLRGVLRSELQDHLTNEIARYVRNPVVRVWPTIRVTVQGTVGQPGFYTFPASLPLGDAIMQAGGPGADANMGRINVRRGTTVVLDGDAVQQAIADGRSFDQLGLRPGDEIIVPAKADVWRYVLRWGVPLASILLLGIRIGGYY
jgi:protein involved in polysaccharide export with SLBB domain